jgi:hypothetical protein
VYFDNPFSEQVMASVLQNLARSHEQHPRSVVVVYQQLREEPESSSTSNLALLDEQPFLTGRTLTFRSGIACCSRRSSSRLLLAGGAGRSPPPVPDVGCGAGHERSTTRSGRAPQEGRHHPFGDHGEPLRR